MPPLQRRQSGPKRAVALSARSTGMSGGQRLVCAGFTETLQNFKRMDNVCHSPWFKLKEKRGGLLMVF